LVGLKIRTEKKRSQYEIAIGPGILSRTGEILQDAFKGSDSRIALISNRRVFSLFGDQVVRSLEDEGFQVLTLAIGDGEAFKSWQTTEKVLAFLLRAGFDRSDQVVSLGGGVVGDLAGFAASIYMRGINFAQIPTTLLSQVDASVGGKTGVNSPTGKNVIGSFHQPRAVIIDPETLITLPSRELSAGWYETIKHGAISGKKLFNQTTQFLREFSSPSQLRSQECANLIRAHVAFKGSVVSADEREAVTRKDNRSRKILNFGHTVAHALESITEYKRFRHGEAVGHGILAAGAISKNLGLLDSSELELLRDGVRLCGTLPSASDVKSSAIIRAIAGDKKRVSGSVQWVLLERIGRPKLIDAREISPALLKESLSEALKGKVK